MRQAIQTTWFGPTNRRGSRIIAKADAGRVTVPWDYSRGIEGNHRMAAETLAVKLGWECDIPLIGGSLPGSSGFAFVFAD